MSGTAPLVSIITVSKNSARTIGMTIESVLKQTYSNIEYYILDGASTDDTISIIKFYEDKFSGRLRWKSEKDAGIYYAMNEGLSMIRGDIVGIINSDDWYELDAVETVVNEFNKHPITDVIYGILRHIKNEKEYRIAREHHDFLSEFMITHPTCFVRSSIYKKYGMFDTQYHSAADYEFMLRIWIGKAVFRGVDKILANFRIGGMSFGINSNRESHRIRRAYGFMNNRSYRIELLKIFIKQLFNRFL